MSKLGQPQRWYAVQTRSNLEKCVTTELTAKGLENYCPVYQEVHQWADRKKLIQRPVFPGYVFTRFADTESARLLVVRTHGTVRILGMGETIEPIPDQEIDSIRRMLTSAHTCFAHPFLRQGSWVRVRSGALKGMEGILVRVKNTTRLVLSINLLSNSVATEVDVRDVEVIPPRLHSRR